MPEKQKTQLYYICNMFKQVFLAIGVLSLAFVTGCNQKIEYSIIPEITMSDRQVYQSPSAIIIGFTDGDGDIGLNQGDTLPPYNLVPDSTNPGVSTNLRYYNLFFYYFVNKDGVWVNSDDDLLIPFYSRVPVVTPTGQNKALKGEIEYAFVIEEDLADSFRFEIELMDRAANVSNRIVTQTIYK